MGRDASKLTVRRSPIAGLTEGAVCTRPELGTEVNYHVTRDDERNPAVRMKIGSPVAPECEFPKARIRLPRR